MLLIFNCVMHVFDHGVNISLCVAWGFILLLIFECVMHWFDLGDDI